jgi:2-polyprenyl-3-methyl-5-hydroxy-6-metoxy-1,4-benzoquinol methylase
MTTDSERAWNYYGNEDPYFGVLTADRFRRETLDEAAREEFFDSGRRYVAEALATVADHVLPGFRPTRALDFGCGVGRLLIPLAEHADDVVGVDVSEGMLAEAERNLERAGVSNCILVRSDDALSQVQGTFDLIHSSMVFQHIPPSKGEQLVQAMLDRLEPGGVGVLDFTYGYASSSRSWRRWLNTLYQKVPVLHGVRNLARGERFGKPLMQMNTYDLNTIMGLLQEAGCVDVHVGFTERLAYRLPLHAVILYFRRPELVAADANRAGSA